MSSSSSTFGCFLHAWLRLRLLLFLLVLSKKMPSRAPSSSAGGNSGVIDLYAAGIIYVGVLTVVCAAFPKRIPIGK
jgi:hypothetical protein